MRIFIYKCDMCSFIQTVELQAGYKQPSDLIEKVGYLELCQDCIHKLIKNYSNNHTACFTHNKENCNCKTNNSITD